MRVWPRSSSIASWRLSRRPFLKCLQHVSLMFVPLPPQEWLRKNDFVDIVKEPQPNFGKVKDAILHGTIGFSKSDHPIRLMRVGLPAWRLAWLEGLCEYRCTRCC